MGTSSPLKSLKPIGKARWVALFRAWEKREASRPGWIRHYRERGFPTWRAWRSHSYKDLRPSQRPWTVYQVTHPERVVPSWYTGPFRGWRQFTGGRSITFRALVRRRAVQQNKKVLSILRDFPKTTQLLGVRWRGRIVVIEGMHRAAAVALAARRRICLTTAMTIAIAPLRGRMPNLSSKKIRR